jgi:imidazolonepropionase-like amidohydrolase
MRFSVALALMVMALGAHAEEPKPAVTIIHARTVITSPGEAPVNNQTIVVQDGRIVEVRPGFVPASAFQGPVTLLDLSDSCVLPGLGEMHVHLDSYIGKDKIAASLVPPARRVLDAAHHAEEMLAVGITLARDVGDESGVTYYLRNAINDGVARGPRLYVAGRIVSRTGGHGIESYYMDSVPKPEKVSGGCDGIESCRRIVRENVDAGSDLIKVTITGSASDEWGMASAAPMLFPDEIQAIADTARQLKRPVAVHAHSTAGINAALKAGVTTIEHGTYINEESARLFKSTGAYLVPTQWISDYINTNMERFRSRNTPADFLIMQRATADGLSTAIRAYRMGIKLATGTDSMSDSDPRATIHELELFVKEGIPAAEALKAATVNAAAIVGMAGQLGQVKAGFLADLVAVHGDPLQDISVLRQVDFVMKNGLVVRSGSTSIR